MKATPAEIFGASRVVGKFPELRGSPNDHRRKSGKIRDSFGGKLFASVTQTGFEVVTEAGDKTRVSFSLRSAKRIDIMKAYQRTGFIKKSAGHDFLTEEVLKKTASPNFHTGKRMEHDGM